MRVRKLTVAVAVLAAAAGLTACTSKVGVAAAVGGHNITEADVSRYITPAGPSPSVVAAVQSQGQTLNSKVQALSQLIEQQVFTRALAASGAVPTDAELTASHDQAVATISGTQLTGADYDSALTGQMSAYGYTNSFAPVIIRVQELEYALVTRLKVTSLAELAAAVDKLNIPISVSGRYGSWDPTQLALASSPDAGLPSFVSFAPTPGASATPTSSGTPAG